MKKRGKLQKYIPEGLNVVGTVGSAGEIRQVELNLVPAFIEAHGHRADEGLDTRRGLIVGRAESTADVLVIEDLDFEGEVLLQLFQRNDTPWLAKVDQGHRRAGPDFDGRHGADCHLRS